jgi:DNA-binding PadR family transcriptional regulator
VRNLTKAQFLIMAALLRHPMHPYAIRQEIIQLTQIRIFPAESTIRNAIKKLEKLGYIEECVSNPYYWLKAKRSAPYELTERGRNKIEREIIMYYIIGGATRKYWQPAD